VGWDIAGAQVLVTGATSGIGRAAATELARRGAAVTITARDEQRGRETAAAIRADTGVEVEVGLLDLSSLESVRRFAAEFLTNHDTLDVLVNNAGTMTGRRLETPDGLERTFAVNHVGPFLLTALLTDRLVSSAPSRVISVSSEVHRSARRGLDFTDLQMTRGWSAQKAYAASKLATVLMTVELDRRLGGRGVTVRAVHPGVVATNFGKGPEGRRSMRVMMTALAPLLKKPAAGAAPIVLLATAPDEVVDRSLYWVESKPGQPSPAAQDSDAAAMLWDATERLAGLKP
jgi:NAD(P)-dependent dehydrogenase (short-subunit alcohol dehydrogenase family)